MGNISKIRTVATVGYDGKIIEVECDITKGLPNFRIVGLANKSIDEARERVRSAITNSLLDFPSKHITINLAPAEIPKDGTHYDLPIALAILGGNLQLKPSDTEGAAFAGELALNGELRPITGSISIAETARDAGCKTLYIPKENVDQAALVEGIDVIGVTSLKELYLHLKNESKIVQDRAPIAVCNSKNDSVKLDDVKGQDQAKRALIIAAAGHHNILLSGPPGAGKTMLARVLSTLLPDMTSAETLSVTKIYSLAGEVVDEPIHDRPFRSPHHTASRTSLIGGGTKPMPGEVSLAHLGVLFLDEIPEYPRATIEALRQPLEDRKVTITRAGGRGEYPSDFMLVATMNPCPCGYYGDDTHECTCSTTQILNYQQKLSGPFMDRIDLKLSLRRVPHEQIFVNDSMINTQHEDAKKCIQKAIMVQRSRYERSFSYNSNLSNRAVLSKVKASDSAHDLLIKAAKQLNLSARATIKTLKVARTIADLDESPTVEASHLSEALQYRL